MEHCVQTKPYDSADYLDSEEAIVTYLKAAFEEGDYHDVCVAINGVKLALVARNSGFTRSR